ncbi:MAG TPA: FAD-dependent oxidoreductase [Acidimicrobiia bacterium]|nr:FAD-dependent oxidoreductase [Acidimicrobiia bacterium]
MSELMDLRHGFTQDDLDDRGILVGQVDNARVAVVAVSDQIHAIGASCTHYHGNLDQGIFDGTCLRCPLHHARYDLLTGEPTAPAFAAVAVYDIVADGDRFRVTGKRPAAPHPQSSDTHDVVIVGGGGAAFAAADRLRRRGHLGRVVMISDDTRPAYDRPNVSKDYLAGEAPDEWMPLASDEDLSHRGIEVLTGESVTAIDREGAQVVLESGARIGYDSLLLATGAEPIRLSVPGAERGHLLRTMDDADRVITAAAQARTAVVVGAGFIGLEVAASLRKRGLEVTVVALEAEPLEAVMGPELGAAIRADHEANGVRFRMGSSIVRVEDEAVFIDDGSSIPADLVVIGIGVQPRTTLAAEAGLDVDDGVLVDNRLRSSDPAILAAGDVARFPHGDERIRIEHWVVAERQGQVAADIILGADTVYADVPFFWSVHFDVRIRFVGYAGGHDERTIVGDLGSDGAVFFRRQGQIVAVATVGRDRLALEAELALEEGDQKSLERMAAG